jgi:hypothetical protein
MEMEMVLVLGMILMQKSTPTPRRSGDDGGFDFHLFGGLEATGFALS